MCVYHKIVIINTSFKGKNKRKYLLIKIKSKQSCSNAERILSFAARPPGEQEFNIISFVDL